MTTPILSYLRFFILLICFGITAHSSNAQEPGASRPKQFIYVLHLVPRLYSDAAWTKDDEAVIARHLARFKHAIETGQLYWRAALRNPATRRLVLRSLKLQMKRPRVSSWRAIRRLSSG
jgi:hypothetical protein